MPIENSFLIWQDGEEELWEMFCCVCRLELVRDLPGGFGGWGLSGSDGEADVEVRWESFGKWKIYFLRFSPVESWETFKKTKKYGKVECFPFKTWKTMKIWKIFMKKKSKKWKIWNNMAMFWKQFQTSTFSNKNFAIKAFRFEQNLWGSKRSLFNLLFQQNIVQTLFVDQIPKLFGK